MKNTSRKGGIFFSNCFLKILSAAASTSIVIVKGINEIVLNYNRTVDGGSGNPDEVDYKVVAYYKTVNGGSSDIVSVVLKEGKGKVAKSSPSVFLMYSK